MSADVTLECQRAQFVLPDGLHYLNGAYMSPLSRRVLAAGEQGLYRKAVPTQIEPADFFSHSQRARQLFARIIQADAEQVAVVPAVSYAMAIFARHLRPEANQKIVIAGEQFPSNVYAWRRLAHDTGAILQTVAGPAASPRAPAWNAALLEAVDDDTAFVALPHVHWTDGTLFDLDAIGARARRVGAALIVDGTQSFGALDFNVARIQPDAVVASAYKWLMGPYGTGFAWFGPRFAQAQPLEEGWLGRADADNFSRLVDYQSAYAPGARRFDAGGHASPIHLPMANAGMEDVLAYGVDARQAYCQQLIAPFHDAFAELGMTLEPAAGRGAHLFGLRLPEHGRIARVEQQLKTHNVVVSIRGDAVRVSPNVYNDANDMQALYAALETALA